MISTPGGNWYAVHLIELPPTVIAAVVLLSDGTFDVFINCCLNVEMQRKGMDHEIRHIDGGHLYNDILTVEEMELEAG